MKTEVFTHSSLQKNYDNPILSAVERLESIGLIVTPLCGKNPFRQGWHKEHIDRGKYAKIFLSHVNIGIRTGATSGVVDIDADCPEVVGFLEQLLPPTNAIYGRKSRPKSHWLYTVASPGPRKAFKDAILAEQLDEEKAMIVEYRGNDVQSMCPPSLHPDEDEGRLKWIDDSFISNRQRPSEATHEDLMKVCARSAMAVMRLRYSEDQISAHPKAAENMRGWQAIIDGVIKDESSLLDNPEKRLRERTSASIRQPAQHSRSSPTNSGINAFDAIFDKFDQLEETAFVKTALEYVNSDDRDVWLSIGGALHDKFGEAGREIWDPWSSKSSKFDSKDQDRTWKSFSRQGISKRSSIGSIIALARRNGFEGRKYEGQSSFNQDNYDSENDTSHEIEDINKGEWNSNDSTEAYQDSDVWFLGDELPKQKPALVEGLIPNQGFCVLGGQSGAGKTYGAAHLSTALASGSNFFGHDIPERGGVIYIAAEGGDTLPPRLQAARIGLGLEDKSFPIAVINCGIGDLSNDIDLRRLIQKIKRLAARIQQIFSCPARMVVIDTLSSAFSIKDENSAAEMAKLCKRLMALGACINAVTLAVHHYGKSSEAGPRGSSSLRASADAIIAVLAKRDELNGSCSNRRLVLVKSRTGVEGITHPFELESVEIGARGFDSIVAAKVVPRELAEAGLKGDNNRPYSLGLKRFIYALEQALIESGQETRIWADGSIVKAVDREKVRIIFYANMPSDGDSTMINNARRKAFQRGYEDAEKRHLAKCYEHNGAQLMWLLT